MQASSSPPRPGSTRRRPTWTPGSTPSTTQRGDRAPTGGVDLPAGRPDARIASSGSSAPRRRADLTRAGGVRRSAAARTQAFDDLTPPRRTPGPGGRGPGGPRRRRGADARRPPANLVTMQTLTGEAVAAEQNVAALVADNEAAQGEAPPGPRPRPRMLARLKREEARIKREIAAAVAPPRPPPQPRATPAYTRHLRRLPGLPGHRPGDLAVRLPDPPDLRLLGPARRHRLRRRVRRGDATPSPTAPSSRSTTPRSTATGSTSPSARVNGHNLIAVYNHATQLPRRRGRRTSAAARSSGTSARPAGPPAATCTSRSSQDGERRRPDELPVTLG